jgi:hypothetical protein
VDQAFVLEIWEVCADSCIHHTLRDSESISLLIYSPIACCAHPDDVGTFSLHRDLALPLAISVSTASDALAHLTSRTIQSEKVLGPYSRLLMVGYVLNDNLDRVFFGKIVMRRVEGLARNKLVLSENTSMWCRHDLLSLQVLASL